MPPRRCRWQTADTSSRRAGSSKRGRPRRCSKVPTFSGRTSGSRASVWPLLVALTIAGCTVGPLGGKHIVGVVKLGADLPLSGDDAPDGIPVKNAVELAIKKAGLVCGAASHTDACVTLQLVTYDDATTGIHDPAQGANNLRLLPADHRLVAL